MKWTLLLSIIGCGVSWRRTMMDENGVTRYVIDCDSKFECTERITNTCPNGARLSGLIRETNGVKLIVECK